MSVVYIYSMLYNSVRENTLSMDFTVCSEVCFHRYQVLTLQELLLLILLLIVRLCRVGFTPNPVLRQSEQGGMSGGISLKGTVSLLLTPIFLEALVTFSNLEFHRGQEFQVY